MALLTEHVERSERLEKGKRIFSDVVAMRPIAYREAGVLKRNVVDIVVGDATFPHVVTRAGMMMYAGGDGKRRLCPTRDATKYLAIGAPYFPSGSTWQKVNFGAATRTANKITWSTAAADLSIVHAGHFVKLEIPLKSAAAKAVGRIAFPFDLVGLTYSQGVLYDNGKPVMQLRAPVAYDADNRMDVRPIAWQFASVAGQTYIVLTIPSLTGMSRPVIDPTLTLQPGSADGVDTFIRNDAEWDMGADASTYVGGVVGYWATFRALIRFDLSLLPSASVISSAVLSLYAIEDWATNASTYHVYRMKRAWTEPATWQTYNGVNNWTAVGGFDAADCEQTDIGFRDFTATETLNEFKDFPLTPTTKAGLDLGYGWMVKAAIDGIGSANAYRLLTSDHATAAWRPKLVVEYALPPSGIPLILPSLATITPGGGRPRIGGFA